ncbi:MAG: phage late control D family protein, partial [Caldilineaceae bacterium]|nr:phage late control D family protein [Caldilineaceae bacterium]
MNRNRLLQTDCQISLGGQNASAAVMQALMRVTIEQGLHLPSLCLLTFQDDELALIDSKQFDVGQEVVVALGTAGTPKPLFDGEIVGLELQPTPGGILSCVVRAYDRSHRLHRGKQTRTFVQMTDSDITTDIAREVGLKPDVEETDEVYEYLLQDNCTNYEFLRRRAKRTGTTFWVEGGQLHSRILASGTSTPIELLWGPSLHHFHPILSARHQVDTVLVRGWDVKEKREILGQASTGRRMVQGDSAVNGVQIANNAFGDGQCLVVDRPVTTQAEADIVAQALCDELSSTFLEAEGRAAGTSELIPGAVVAIPNVG